MHLVGGSIGAWRVATACASTQSAKAFTSGRAALRGQMIMWHRLLTEDERSAERNAGGLFGVSVTSEPRLCFGEPPSVELETRVPEDGWGGGKKKTETAEQQEGLFA